MTTTEFSDQFDVLYNNITSNQAPGLNEYEKSIFLTKAQNELVKDYFNPKGNKYQEGFDGSLKRMMDFSSLIEVKVLSKNTYPSTVNLDSRGIIYDYPSDVFIPINETIVLGNKQLQVLPISYMEYIRLMSKPYKRPLKNQCWKLVVKSHSALKNVSVEIILPVDSEITTYTLRYVKTLSPIILSDLTSEGVTIEGISKVTNCALPKEAHEEILQRAIELAKNAYIGDLSSIVDLGQRSE